MKYVLRRGRRPPTVAIARAAATLAIYPTLLESDQLIPCISS